jgi:hypothetical protein
VTRSEEAAADAAASSFGEGIRAVRRRHDADALVISRSGSDLRHHRHTPIARHGHPGQAYCISPWQNGFAERLIGSIRRECVDHFVVLGIMEGIEGKRLTYRRTEEAQIA